MEYTIQNKSGLVSRRYAIGTRTVNSIMLYIVVIGIFDVPQWINRLFFLPLPELGNTVPYLAPVSLLVLLYNHSIYNGHGLRISLRSLDILWIVTIIVMIFSELYHAVISGEPTQFWYILDYFWIYFFYVVLSSFDYVPDYYARLYKAIINVVICISIFQLSIEYSLSNLVQKAVPFIDLTELFNANAISYMALLAFTLVLFDSKEGAKTWAGYIYWISLPLLIAVIFTEWTRSAIILVFVIMLIWFFLSANTFFFKRIKFLLLAFFLVLVMLYFNEINDFFMKIWQGWAAINMSWLASGDAASSYIRIRVIAETFNEWVKQPFIGLGMQGIENIKVLGFSLHAGIFIPLFAYGLIGFTPFFMTVVYLMARILRNRNFTGLALMVLMLGIPVFMTQLPYWFAFLLYLLVNYSGRGLRHQNILQSNL